MKKILVLTIVIAMFFISCTKKDNGIKTYFNSSTPANPNFTIEIVESHELNNADGQKLIDTPFDVTEDKDGNIYVLSMGNSKVIKYNKDFEYLFDFAGAGNGPGELQGAQSMFILEDTLFVADFQTKKINRYRLDGQFINSFHNSILSSAHSFCEKNNYFLNQSIKIYNEGNNGRSKLTLLDSDFKVIKDLADLGETDNYIFFLTRISYALTNENIYVAENSHSNYRINIFDYKGEKIGKINKDFALVPFEYKKDVWSKFFGSKYKRVISNLYTDYDDNLWVMKAQKDSINREGNRIEFKFDVFQNGVFMNEVKFDSLSFEPNDYEIRTKIIGDKIFSMYIAEDKVVVSKYVIKEK